MIDQRADSRESSDWVRTNSFKAALLSSERAAT